MPTALLNGTEIFYLDEGKGNPIVFIHGLGATHEMFEPQVETFSKSHRVICPDIRGNGQSGKLTGPIRTVLDRQCDDIALLLDKLGIEKAVFAGTSYGGVFCFHFVLRYPERVKALVITDSFGDTQIVGITEALLMLSQYGALWSIYLPRSWLIPAVKHQYRHWPLAQKHLVRIVSHMRNHEHVLQRLAINAANHTRNLGQVHCPALGLVGNFTKVGVRYMQRAMDAIPNSKLEIVPNSFDPTNLCQREIYDRLVADFLKEIGW
ncbi:alpha/beta fold hydrolase [Aneurinibacillus tyrosinisolvens]|uniref:alpha/beta fold hydrolase n=1 Tax=Aneurinibacillus tyrosinisolvens TaxID=1443435 RepID=UPI00063F314C|nr:alpha/beta hydrolase [Aneurinibacillus tyrosinisolvens]